VTGMSESESESESGEKAGGIGWIRAWGMGWGGQCVTYSEYVEAMGEMISRSGTGSR